MNPTLAQASGFGGDSFSDIPFSPLAVSDSVTRRTITYNESDQFSLSSSNFCWEVNCPMGKIICV